MQRIFSLLILILAGLILVLYGHESITSYLQNWIHPKPKQLWFCPAPDQVVANQSNPGAFTVNGLDWVIDYHGWTIPEKIGFMQVLITEDYNVSCYYRWSNPKEPGTNLWMTVKLSPLVTQTISTYGSYWQQDKSSSICSAGINACAFEIK
ncbi:hypothetical protein [Legionella saoudiensis]|uniref:hypothetical protein n=1 Tax=Legionella saoudiensis TaxID=1750561 RepID=UPI0007307E4E|nr:hypothetical protein [Legionella saoudiensis]